MFRLINGVPLECRCGCGQHTMILKVHPGAKRPKYHGFITGHEYRPDVSNGPVLGPEWMAQKRVQRLRSSLILDEIRKRVGPARRPIRRVRQKDGKVVAL